MLRILCLLLFIAGPVCGQSIADSPRINEVPLYTSPRHTAADTVEALHLLFRNRRTTGGLLIGLGGIAAVATPLIAVAAAGPPTSTYGHLPETVGGIRLGFLIAAPIAAFGFTQLEENSKKKEEQVVAQYRDAHTLPRKLAKKLRPELFLPVNSSPYP
jgi:hypothetical protein